MNSSSNFITVKELAGLLNVSTSTVYRWIISEKLDSEKSGEVYLIPFGGDNSEFIRSELTKSRLKDLEPYVPSEIVEYNLWHKTIDEICWLFKICYADKSDIQNKKFKIDKLFVNYINQNDIDLSKLKNIFNDKNNINTTLISDDLKRGWYNELSYSFPLKISTLGISYSDIELNKSSSTIRFMFPSLPIINSYYSTYFYLRSVTLMKYDHFRLEEHKATISCFKNNLLSLLEKQIWNFPLNISFTPGQRIYRKKLLINKLEYLKYKYSYYPRIYNGNANIVFEDVYKEFKKGAKRYKNRMKYTIFDFLHDFRIWANYIDIDNLLSLSGAGYKTFLDQNLSLLLFIIGGIGELCFISVFGANNYIKKLQNFYDVFILNNPELENNFVNTSLYQRHQIYYKLEIIKKLINTKVKEDINRISI